MNERNNNYCTIASKEYILKSLALYDSICRHNNNFHFWICTIDKPSHDLIKKLNLPNTTTIDIASIENNNLLRAKNNRSITEYCWTVKASFIKFIFKQYRKAKSIIYVDADIYLLSEPSLLFQQLEKNDVLLTCHNFSNRFLHLYKQKGKYNAGIIGFRNNANALQILSWWEKRCIEWCYDQVTSNRFADQKYLEIIEKRYPKV
ncbi:MAG: glycosyltransferase, partial [Lutispora sp.]